MIDLRGEEDAPGGGGRGVEKGDYIYCAQCCKRIVPYSTETRFNGFIGLFLKWLCKAALVKLTGKLFTRSAFVMLLLHLLLLHVHKHMHSESEGIILACSLK